MDVHLLNSGKLEKEIDSIQGDFSYIIHELDGISHGLNSNFKGIGTENCAKALDDIRLKFQNMSNGFNAINGTYKCILNAVNEFAPDSNKENN